MIRFLEMFFLYVMNTFINTFAIFNAALISYLGFENASCQVVGTHCKHFLVEEKGSSTQELIHDGRTRERKRSSLHHRRRQGAGRGNEIEGFYYGLWLPIHGISSRGQPKRVILEIEIREMCEQLLTAKKLSY